jgi:hypothetical protein
VASATPRRGGEGENEALQFLFEVELDVRDFISTFEDVKEGCLQGWQCGERCHRGWGEDCCSKKGGNTCSTAFFAGKVGLAKAPNQWVGLSFERMHCTVVVHRLCASKLHHQNKRSGLRYIHETRLIHCSNV